MVGNERGLPVLRFGVAVVDAGDSKPPAHGLGVLLAKGVDSVSHSRLPLKKHPDPERKVSIRIRMNPNHLQEA